MKTTSLRLEIFETVQLSSEECVYDAHQAEQLRETAYEQGYGAGWQDALSHMRNEDVLRATAAQEALQALAFGYHEARSALQDDYLRLLANMFDALLPDISGQLLTERVRTEVDALLAQGVPDRLTVHCAAAMRPALEKLFASQPTLKVDLKPVLDCPDAQIMLSISAQERVVDFSGFSNALRDAIDALLLPSCQKESAHG